MWKEVIDMEPIEGGEFDSDLSDDSLEALLRGKRQAGSCKKRFINYFLQKIFHKLSQNFKKMKRFFLSFL